MTTKNVFAMKRLYNIANSIDLKLGEVDAEDFDSLSMKEVKELLLAAKVLCGELMGPDVEIVALSADHHND